MAVTQEHWDTTNAIKTALIAELSKLKEKYSFNQPETDDFFGARISIASDGNFTIEASFDDDTLPAIYPMDDKYNLRRDAVQHLRYFDPDQISYVTSVLAKKYLNS